MTDKPQHCDHECVCNWWACNVNCDILNDPCRRKNCEHDTRSRPLSSELKKERERMLEVVDIECQEIQSRIESSAMGNPLSERERGRIIGILDIRVKLDSLRG